MIQVARRFAKSKELNAIVLLDAYFTSGDAFDAVSVINNELGSQQVNSNTRAKVAYEEPEPIIKRGRIRPRKNGKKVTFKQVFQEMVECFRTATLKLCVKEETVKYFCMDLI